MSYNWSDESVLLLIEKFRENEMLWNPNNSDYKHRFKRTEAVHAIASLFCTDRSEVERKLKNITSHYFRERKKVEELRRSGEDVHEPKWFAYKALDFLREKNTPIQLKSDNSQEGTSFERTKASMKRKASPPPRVLNQSFKSYKTTPKPSTSGTTDIQDSSGPKDFSEFDITGMSVTKKLSKMDPVQAIYAESIINNVLRRGLLKNLTEATDLCDNNCNSRVIRTPLFVDLPSNSYGHEHADSPHSNPSSSDINIKEEF